MTSTINSATRRYHKAPRMIRSVALALVIMVLTLVQPTMVQAGPLQNFYESPLPYWADDSTGPVTLSHNATAQSITVAGGDATGNLSVGIPIERKDTQQIGVYMSVANLTSTVRYELCSDGTASGQYADVNSTHVVFRDGTYGNLTDEVILDFYAFDSIARFWITAHNDTGLIRSFERWYGLAGNNWLNLTSTFLNGSMVLYYVTGDTDYRTFHETPLWIQTGTPDPTNVEQGPNFCMTDDTDDDINHDVTYTKAMPYFAYLRTEQYLDFAASGAGDGAAGTLVDPQGFHLTFTMWDSDGNEDIYVEFWVQLWGNTVSTAIKTWSNISVRTNGESWGNFINMNSDSIADNDDTITHIAIWRTLENGVGIMWSSNTYIYQMDGVDWPTSEDEHQTWTSDDSWSDWSNCSVSLRYKIDHNIVGSYDIYEYCEYGQWESEIYRDSGVAQPHFSSVWWTGSGGQQWDSAPFYSEEDAYTEDDPPLPWWLGPFVFLGDLIAGALAGIGTAVAGGLIALATGASVLWVGILNMLSPNLGTNIFDALASGVSAMTAGGGAVIWFVATIGPVLDIFTAVLGWITWFLSQENVQLCIGLALVLLPAWGYQQDGFDGVMYWLGLYAMVFIGIFKALWSIGTTIVGLIGNFMPFT